MDKISGQNVDTGQVEFKFQDGTKIKKVHPDLNKLAGEIDTNQDKILHDKELKAYMREHDILRDPTKARVDEKQIMKDYKLYLQGKPLPQAKAYHTYEQMVAELQQLQKDFPGLAKMVSLGKSPEKREIWALKISKDVNSDTSSKPGVVFTGTHHAREWISMEVPLYTANQLLNGYDSDPVIKRRVDEAEIWVVPLVNPDGYEYSRTKESFWRKSRRPIDYTGCEKNTEGNICDWDREKRKIYGMGVDLNRNYDDGIPEHKELYRPKGDKPCNTWDDFSATSDDPQDDTYRGPSGASEPEVKFLLDLELGHKNIKGIIDFHSYGEMMLYPWGHTYDPPENEKTYKEIGEGMNKAMGGTPYRLMQSVNLYPASGSSENIHHVNKRISFTIELARSFQPKESQIEPICEKLNKANMYFLDWIIDHKDSIPW